MKGLNTMEKTVSTQDAPQRFGELLQEVTDRGDRYVVERDGVPLAVVVPFALYSQWKRHRETFFQEMRETADRVNLSEEEAIQLTDEVKRAARAHP